MNNPVLKLLQKLRADGENFTHTSMINPMGRFYIARDVQDTFWDVYCEYIENCPDPMVGLTEKPKPIMAFYVDVDLAIEEPDDYDMNNTLYSDQQLTQIVKTYQSILHEIIEDVEDEHLICFVLEKPPYLKEVGGKKKIKNGFHLHFPYVFLHNEEIKNHIIPKAKKQVKELGVFKNLGYVDSSIVIDDAAVLKNNWLLYGSKKGEREKCYLLTRIFTKDMEDIELEVALKKYKLYDSQESLIDIIGKEYFYLPRILSILPNGRMRCNVKNNIISIFTELSKKERKKNVKTFDEAQSSVQLKEVKGLIDLLSLDRVNDFSKWRDVMFGLFNISNGSDEGLSLFLEFSKKYTKGEYDEDDCISRWEKLTVKETGIGIGSFKYWAKEDNPEGYKKFTTSRMIEHIKFASDISGGHNDFARALKERYGDIFVCSSYDSDIWYEFRQHRWRRIDKGHSLLQKITEDLIPLINGECVKCVNELSREGDGDGTLINKKIMYYKKMIMSLKTNTFKKSIMAECREVFYREDFREKLNKNKDLFAFKNGIYDLTTDTFRDGRPEDYISLCGGIDYQEFHEDHPLVVQVLDFLEKVFPDKELRNYFLNISGDVFKGGNQYKKVHFWSGEGDNAKSITQMFFERIMGEYACKLPTSLITGKRSQSSAANPELARAGDGKRWIVLDEPDKTENINLGMLKMLSGNDKFSARGLYKEQEDYDPMFKIIVICNEPPKVTQGGDKAVWNRIRVIPFESKFCDPGECPEDPDEQLRLKRFPKDPFFEEKIPSMLQAFAWVLLNHRKKKLPRFEPEKVTQATKFYKIKNDVYQLFITEALKAEDDAVITIQDMYTSFKEWFRDSMPNHSVPTKAELRDYVLKNYDKLMIGNSKLKGYRAKTREDEYEGEIVLSDNDLYNGAMNY